MLNWDDFRVVLALARSGTLSAAALQLHVDQSTMSRRLAALEAASGARLFERTPTGYTLTSAAEAVREHAEEIESRAIAIERQLAGRDARPEGVVRLAASDSFATWFLLPRWPELCAAFPGVTVNLVTGNRAVSLSRREADVSLRLSKPDEPSLVARRLGRAAWALYASPAYLARHGKPSLRTGLAGQHVVGFDAELRGTLGARWLAQHATRAKVALSTSSLVTQAAAVVAGLGVSPLPCVFGDREPGVVRALPATLGHHDIWLVVHPDVRGSARVRAVMDFCAALIEREAALLSGKLNGRRQQRQASRRASPSRAAE